MSSFTANDVKMPVDDDGWNKRIKVWFVKDHTDYGYPTKTAAESAARILHPGKDSNSMVFYVVAFFGGEDWE